MSHNISKASHIPDFCLFLRGISCSNSGSDIQDLVTIGCINTIVTVGFGLLLENIYWYVLIKLHFQLHLTDYRPGRSKY